MNVYLPIVYLHNFLPYLLSKILELYSSDFGYIYGLKQEAILHLSHCILPNHVFQADNSFLKQKTFSSSGEVKLDITSD